MDVFVIVALALAVLSLGAVGVAGVALVRTVKGLAAAAGRTMELVRPLTEELAAETAVTTLEIDALQRNIAARRDAPGRRG